MLSAGLTCLNQVQPEIVAVVQCFKLVLSEKKQ